MGVHGNIFNVDLLNQHCFTKELLSNSDFVVFIASTAFTHRMMEDLAATLLSIFDDESELKSESNSKDETNELFVITLSHPLPIKDRFKVLHKELFRMSWGNVMVYFQ